MRAAAVLLCLPAALATSCSDGAAADRTAYLEQGNAICAEAADEVAELQRQILSIPLEGEDPTAANGIFLDQAADVYGAAIEDLQALDPPPGDAEELQRIYDEGEQGIAALRAVDPAEGLPPDDPLAAFNADATAYGLTSCGSAGAPAAG